LDAAFDDLRFDASSPQGVSPDSCEQGTTGVSIKNFTHSIAADLRAQLAALDKQRDHLALLLRGI
jgi:hypothetical protein